MVGGDKGDKAGRQTYTNQETEAEKDGEKAERGRERRRFE